ncbi:MAG TPA: twin-arginine translocation signal domain-containing protein [Burkholderiales bacterium]|nr:twin-arginine translocation signal domain-containing protein [Burkholderiales bacterium]
MERRDFVKLCAAGAAALAAPGVQANATPRLYARARLVDEKGEPLRAGAIPANRNLIFHYPYAATPCFLLNLGRPVQSGARLKTADQTPYEWSGGVGPGRSIVAYSAICAHKLTYPTRDISFISYRAEKTPGNRFASVIHCCSEHSQYDPAEGGRVLAGPAPQPLAAILLQYDDASNELFAVGTLGGEMFHEFFEKYAFRLQMEQGANAHATVTGSCVVRPLENYCRQQVKC